MNVGGFAVVFILLALTELPYWAYYHLAALDDKLTETPDYIVVMGSDGMPSPSGLLCTYYGVEMANKYPRAKIILALPYNEKDSTRQLKLMAKEFVVKGIDSNRIVFEPNGYNTKSQADQVAKIVADSDRPIMIVSRPEHMYRCLATFRKAGLNNVGGKPSFEFPSDEDKLKSEDEESDWAERSLILRYNIWSYMQYEIKVLREYTAISFYWFKGWI